MTAYRTADAIRQDYTTRMGRVLGGQFYRLWNECAWLYLKWAEYRALFGTSQHRIDILNASAPRFARMLQLALRDDILLHVCTLTDDVEVGRRRRQTLSVCRLPVLVDAAIRERVSHRVVAARSRCKFARDWRDRRIAHRDLQLAVNQGAKPLPEPTRERTSNAITAIVDVLHVVEGHYLGAQTGYEHVSHSGDAESLLHTLRDGLDARDDELGCGLPGIDRREDFARRHRSKRRRADDPRARVACRLLLRSRHRRRAACGGGALPGVQRRYEQRRWAVMA